MTNEQYKKLVELVNSIEFIDKELIDTNMFIAKFHKIFSKDYEAPTIYPWTNKPGVRDIEAPKTPFYDPIKIMYYGTGTGDPKIMYDGPGTGDNKVMYDGPPEYASFYGINYFDDCDKTNGVDKMKFKVSDDSSGTTRIGNHGITTSNNEIHTILDDNIYIALLKLHWKYFERWKHNGEKLQGKYAVKTKRLHYEVYIVTPGM